MEILLDLMGVRPTVSLSRNWTLYVSGRRKSKKSPSTSYFPT